MSPLDIDDAALARRVRNALTRADAVPVPPFEKMWRHAAEIVRQPWGSPQRLQWMGAALLLPAIVVALWLLRAPPQAPITDGELLQASADTSKKVWRDPLAGVNAGIPSRLREQRIDWPPVHYPLIPEQRYL